ncbi:MAG: sodium/proton-translocating pyrophosphatase [Methylococcaceae bacterium]|nr:sodium/proton-translocating pyrophosphatase [Methylococcaceae bacterium]
MPGSSCGAIRWGARRSRAPPPFAGGAAHGDEIGIGHGADHDEDQKGDGPRQPELLPRIHEADPVGKAAQDMVEEVRRQFREIPGLMEGTTPPDSARCIEISTKASLREMILPGMVTILTPVIVGFLFGKEALGGLLAGSLVCGVLMALFMANAGGAWDNAKKLIEGGALGGKGTDIHKAAICGDTVGDPFKDTSGPALNIVVKLMSVVSLVIAPLL